MLVNAKSMSLIATGTAPTRSAAWAADAAGMPSTQNGYSFVIVHTTADFGVV